MAPSLTKRSFREIPRGFKQLTEGLASDGSTQILRAVESGSAALMRSCCVVWPNSGDFEDAAHWRL